MVCLLSMPANGPDPSSEDPVGFQVLAYYGFDEYVLYAAYAIYRWKDGEL